MPRKNVVPNYNYNYNYKSVILYSALLTMLHTVKQHNENSTTVRQQGMLIRTGRS